MSCTKGSHNRVWCVLYRARSKSGPNAAGIPVLLTLTQEGGTQVAAVHT